MYDKRHPVRSRSASLMWLWDAVVWGGHLGGVDLGNGWACCLAWAHFWRHVIKDAMWNVQEWVKCVEITTLISMYQQEELTLPLKMILNINVRPSEYSSSLPDKYITFYRTWNPSQNVLAVCCCCHCTSPIHTSPLPHPRSGESLRVFLFVLGVNFSFR